ncbi:MAG: hypothetical protein U0235_16925 [Polyangiaceae bacterium]
MRTFSVLLLSFTVLTGCSAPAGEEADGEEVTSNLEQASVCLPFKLAEAGAKRFVNNDTRTCESFEVWGGAHYSVLGHLKDAKRTCGEAATLQQIKASTVLPRLLAKDFDFYVVNGEVSGPDFKGFEKVLAEHELEFGIIDPPGGYGNETATLRLRPGGKGALVRSVRGQVKSSRAFAYRVDRSAGVALALEYDDDHSVVRYPAEATAYSYGLKGIAGEINVSDLCPIRNTKHCESNPPEVVCVAK